MHNGVTSSSPRGQLRSSEARTAEEAKNPAAALSYHQLPLPTPRSSPPAAGGNVGADSSSRPLNIKVELQQTTLVSIQLSGGRGPGGDGGWEEGTRTSQLCITSLEDAEDEVVSSVCRWNTSLVLSTLLLAVILSLLIYVETSRMVMVPITIFLIVLSLVLFFFILFCVCFVVFL